MILQFVTSLNVLLRVVPLLPASAWTCNARALCYHALTSLCLNRLRILLRTVLQLWASTRDKGAETFKTYSSQLLGYTAV
jgi:hypothetical protein